MKKIIIISLFVSFTSFSQSKEEVKKILIREYTHKYGDTIQGPHWTFADEEIQKNDFPFITTKYKSKEFFRTKFLFLDDLHSTEDNFIIMYDNKTKKLKMLPPLWFSGMEEKFFKEFIGINLPNDKEKKLFIQDLAKFIMFESEAEIKSIVIEKDVITLNILFKGDDYSDIIQVFMNNDKIVELRRLAGKYQNVADLVK